MNKKYLMGMSAAALALTINAWSAPTASSTASSSSTLAKVKEKVRVTYFGQFLGPSIGATSRYIPTDLEARDSDTIQLYSSIGLGYRIDKTMTAGVSPRFEWRPAGTGAGGPGANLGRGEAGHDLRLLDPRIFFEKANLISTAQFNLKANFNAELPAAVESRRYDLIAAPALSLSGNYNVRNTRLSLGFVTFIRTYFYGTEGTKGRAMRAYFAPNASYKLSKKVAATLNYDMDNRRTRTSKDLMDWNAEWTDLQGGVSWDVTENFSVNPYIQIFPGGKINLDTTSVGMYISGSVL